GRVLLPDPVDGDHAFRVGGDVRPATARGARGPRMSRAHRFYKAVRAVQRDRRRYEHSVDCVVTARRQGFSAHRAGARPRRTLPPLPRVSGPFFPYAAAPAPVSWHRITARP